jgi:hypothetical protein
LYTRSLFPSYSLTSVCRMKSDEVTGSVHVMAMQRLLVTFIIIFDGLSKYEMRQYDKNKLSEHNFVF